jgi:hypothetical protein
MTRVLVAGSPRWPDAEQVKHVLDGVYAGSRDHAVRAGTTDGWMFTVVYAAATRGVARHADQWVRDRARLGYVVEADPFTIEWNGPCRARCPDHRNTHPGGHTTCPSAALFTNEAMVRSGADLCVCFVLDESAGSVHCGIYAKLCADCRPRGTRGWNLDGPPVECPHCGGPAGIPTVTYTMERAR